MKRIVATIVVAWTCTPVRADVAVYTNRAQWINAIGSHTRIGFTGYPHDTNITTQYLTQGVAFTDGDDRIHVNPAFTTDGAGLFSDPPHVRMIFSQDMYGLGFEYTDRQRVDLLCHGVLIYHSELFVAEFAPFFGFISAMPFDEAIVTDPTGSAVTIDNLYFGPAVSAPTAIGLFAIGALAQRRRRKEPI